MDDWESRLTEEVTAAAERAGSKRQLSEDMGVGVNYVQQLMKGKTGIKLPTLIKILRALGRSSATYILFGTRVDDPQTAEIIEAAALIRDPEVKRAALAHIRQMQSFSAQQPPTSDPLD